MSCSKGVNRGIKIAITRIARVRIRARIRSLVGERLEFMAGGFTGRETHTARTRELRAREMCCDGSGKCAKTAPVSR